jgi:hypothetical protein
MRTRSSPHIDPSYRTLFDMIPAPLIWDLIFEAFLQVIDMAILDYAVANKELRAQFFRGLGCKSPEADDHVIKVGRKRVKSSVPLLFYGMSWLHHHETVVADLNAITWLCTRRLQVYGLQVDIRVLQGPTNSLLTHFDSLRDLSMYADSSSDENMAVNFTNYPSCSSLTSLTVPVRTPAQLLRIKECYPKLEKLGFILDMKISEVMAASPNLVKLNVMTHRLDDAEDCRSGPFPSLESLFLACDQQFTLPEDLIEVSKMLPNLSELYLKAYLLDVRVMSIESGEEDVDENRQLVNIFPKLTSLFAENQGHGFRKLLKAIPSLNTLALKNVDFLIREPLPLANIRELSIEKESLDRSPDDSNQLSTALACFPSLHSLTLVNMGIIVGAKYDNKSPKCESLRTIVFDSCRFTTTRRRRNTDAWYPIAKHVASLSFIDCDAADEEHIDRIISSADKASASGRDKLKVVKMLIETDAAA